MTSEHSQSSRFTRRDEDSGAETGVQVLAKARRSDLHASFVLTCAAPYLLPDALIGR